MSIYFDNNSTTKPLEAVTTAMMEVLGDGDGYANPSSTHILGRRARARIEQARETIATMIGCHTPNDVVFTSGGTESISQALFIGIESQKPASATLIMSAVEHAAVLEAAAYHSAQGVRVETVGVSTKGQLDIPHLERVLRKTPKGTLVSIMLANNETGVIFPIPEVAAICRAHGAYLHVDAVQAVGKTPVNVMALGCDYLSLSAHKFHGPKGIGALYIRNGAPRTSLIKGHQESGARGGTENVPGIIGMATAAQAIWPRIVDNSLSLENLRHQLESSILSAIPGTQINGDTEPRLCNTSNIYFPGKNSAILVEQLSARGVHVSSGAACTTGGKPSHVLLAMGLGDERANSSLRFSLSKLSSESEVDFAVTTVKQVFASSLDVHKVD
jgi:cysteine desulfurase